jgi:hypothetical protein
MGTLKIAVLGLGESLASFEPNGYDLTIGVNDIWCRVQTDHIVCVDRQERFTPERLATIKASKPQRFYTQLPEWQYRPDYFAIALQEGYPSYVCQLDLNALPKSLCSPFVAAAVAYKFHDAKEIHLYGVDLRTHPHLHDSSTTRIFQHFCNMQLALYSKGCRIVVHGQGLLLPLNNLRQ